MLGADVPQSSRIQPKRPDHNDMHADELRHIGSKGRYPHHGSRTYQKPIYLPPGQAEDIEAGARRFQAVFMDISP